MKWVLKNVAVHPGCESRRFNANVAWLQQKAEYRSNHHKQATWLAADGSNEFSMSYFELVDPVKCETTVVACKKMKGISTYYDTLITGFTPKEFEGQVLVN